MKKLVLVFAAVVFTAGVVMAQQTTGDNETASHMVTIVVPEVSLIDIEGLSGEGITFTFTAPTEAGSPLQAPAPNSDLWLNLSSTAKAGSSGKTVDVSIDGSFPQGMALKVNASESVSGLGNIGTPTGEITLSETDQTLISGIKSGYTEDGSGKGFQLTYTLVFEADHDAYAALHNEIQPVTVTYTMTGE